MKKFKIKFITRDGCWRYAHEVYKLPLPLRIRFAMYPKISAKSCFDLNDVVELHIDYREYEFHHLDEDRCFVYKEV